MGGLGVLVVLSSELEFDSDEGVLVDEVAELIDDFRRLLWRAGLRLSRLRRPRICCDSERKYLASVTNASLIKKISLMNSTSEGQGLLTFRAEILLCSRFDIIFKGNYNLESPFSSQRIWAPFMLTWDWNSESEDNWNPTWYSTCIQKKEWQRLSSEIVISMRFSITNGKSNTLQNKNHFFFN